jgi:hypothetical protein
MLSDAALPDQANPKTKISVPRKKREAKKP